MTANLKEIERRKKEVKQLIVDSGLRMLINSTCLVIIDYVILYVDIEMSKSLRLGKP